MVEIKTVFLGCDHAGFHLKQYLLEKLRSVFSRMGFEDLGCESESPCHYPQYAEKVAKSVSSALGSRGILICGSGIGMSIAANKVKGIRAAVCWDVTSARLSRQHNDANVLCLGSRLMGSEVALEAAKLWLTTAFDGGRHSERLHLISKLEEDKP